MAYLQLTRLLESKVDKGLGGSLKILSTWDLRFVKVTLQIAPTNPLSMLGSVSVVRDMHSKYHCLWQLFLLPSSRFVSLWKIPELGFVKYCIGSFELWTKLLWTFSVLHSAVPTIVCTVCFFAWFLDQEPSWQELCTACEEGAVIWWSWSSHVLRPKNFDT